MEQVSDRIIGGNISDSFKVLNQVKDQLTKMSAEGQLIKIETNKEKTAATKSKSLQAWKDFKKTISNPGKLSHEETAKLSRIKANLKSTNWNELANLNFRLKDFNLAYSRLKDTAAGPDFITKRMLPKKAQNKEKLLHALNQEIFSCQPLSQTFRKSRTLIISQGQKQRPLSIASKISGLVEIMMIQRIEPAVKAIYQGSRFGFLSGVGVEDFINKMFEVKDDKSSGGLKVGALSIDLRGAFNRVSHLRLILKSHDILISAHYSSAEVSIVLNFICRWLQNRTTRLEGSSQTVEVLRGTPQGAPLSALLFVIYFDVDGKLYGIFMCYADDGTLVIFGSTWTKVYDNIILACNYFNRWCEENEMELAMQKSWFLPFGNYKSLPSALEECPVPVKTSARLLGLVLDQRLNFRLHLQECERFWYFRLKILRIIVRLGLNFRKGLAVIYSFRGKLSYGLLWWLYASKTTQERLCQLWRIAVRIVARIEPSSPLEDFMKAASIPAMDKFIIYLLVKRQFRGKFIREENLQEEEYRSHKYNLRPREAQQKQPQNRLLQEAGSLLDWLNTEALKSPDRSPDMMLRRKMFGLRLDPNTDISELVKLANAGNRFRREMQEAPT